MAHFFKKINKFRNFTRETFLKDGPCGQSCIKRFKLVVINAIF